MLQSIFLILYVMHPLSSLAVASQKPDLADAPVTEAAPKPKAAVPSAVGPNTAANSGSPISSGSAASATPGVAATSSQNPNLGTSHGFTLREYRAYKEAAYPITLSLEARERILSQCETYEDAMEEVRRMARANTVCFLCEANGLTPPLRHVRARLGEPDLGDSRGEETSDEDENEAEVDDQEYEDHVYDDDREEWPLP